MAFGSHIRNRHEASPRFRAISSDAIQSRLPSDVQDRDPENEINSKAPDGRTADEITEPLAAEAARLFGEAEVADTTVDEYPATAKSNSGGRTVQIASAPSSGVRRPYLVESKV
jgi:hypothetical protein